ncbi:MAG: GH1 family beta-glucosidase [Ferruginibacter sp.]
MSFSSLTSKSFGQHFHWGVAIAAAQNEGAVLEDGKGISIWDAFARRKGKIKSGHSPVTAADFYHRYKDDLLLAKALGFNSFRFSLSWSRILPDGTGRINKQGIEFYHKLIDECIQLGLTPFVTIYHWDIPNALEKEGGWTSHMMQKWFERYVKVCAENLGDKVKNWIIMNEPLSFTALGYMIGLHAPGKKGLSNFFSSIHNAAMAQAEGGRIIRALVKNAYIGTTFSCSHVIPFSQKEEDVKAAIRIDILMNRLFIEPALGLGYPKDESFPLLLQMELYNNAWRYTDKMKFDFDFIGLQNYFPVTVRHNRIVPYIHASQVKAITKKVPHNDLGWEIDAESFYKIIKRFWLYGGIKEIIITENGASFKDKVEHGVVKDDKRTDYFQSHLKALLKAKREGVNVKGYFAWTLTDNFEWNEGYNARFGLIHVDFKSQLRTIKNSGHWWRNFLTMG